MRAALLLGLMFLVACGDGSEEPPTVRPYQCNPAIVRSVSISAKFHDVCPGAEQRLFAEVVDDCGRRPDAADATFASSDPVVIAIEGDRALARGTGVAEVTARSNGLVSSPILIRVGRCVDAGP